MQKQFPISKPIKRVLLHSLSSHLFWVVAVLYLARTMFQRFFLPGPDTDSQNLYAAVSSLLGYSASAICALFFVSARRTLLGPVERPFVLFLLFWLVAGLPESLFTSLTDMSKWRMLLRILDLKETQDSDFKRGSVFYSYFRSVGGTWIRAVFECAFLYCGGFRGFQRAFAQVFKNGGGPLLALIVFCLLFPFSFFYLQWFEVWMLAGIIVPLSMLVFKAGIVLWMKERESPT